MKAFKKKPANYEDLRALPDQLVGEIIDEELIASPRPALQHANAASGLTGALRNPFQHGDGGPGGWWILSEPEIHLRANVLVPDVAGWRRERMPRLPAEPHAHLAPDWVCEILSPSTAGVDRLRKMPIYLRESVSHVWLVEPVLRTIEVFRSTGKEWVLIASHVGDQVARIEPFDAYEFTLKNLWLEAEVETAE